MPADIVIVLTTLGAAADAETFARTLVEEQLAACVNVLSPMSSTYRWKGSIEQESERQIVIKTTKDRLPALAARIDELHPYETPELLVLPVLEGEGDYLDWIRESVRPTPGA